MLLTRYIFWITQLVGFCIAAPKIIDPSCPCGPFDTEHAKACCLTGSEIIPEENSTDENETDATVDSMGVTTEFSTTDAEESFEEYSTTEAQTTVTENSSDVTVSPLNIETSKNANGMNIDAAENGNRTEKTASADASRDPENEATFGDANRTLQRDATAREQPRHLNGLSFTEPRQINLGILNKIASSARFPQRKPDNKDTGERDEKIDRFVFRGDVEEGQPEIQNLIDEVTMFESVRISPKKRVLFVIREPQERERQDLERNTNFLVSGRTTPSKALSPMPESVSEKTGNLFERKTLLEAPFTVDEVTSGATNENAKRLGRLDTSIRNLWDPEGGENIQRFTRSRMSEVEDKSKGNVENVKTGVASSSLDSKENKSQGGRAPVKGFKRPPRILPIKNVRNTEVDSSKFVNSRERARSLFNKSNEVRRKHLSISKNGNDFDAMIHETKE